MTDIGFTAASIANVAIVLNLTWLFFEIPSGILADRWSRKGVLIVSSVALSTASLFLGLSSSVFEYTLISVLFGLHFALNSGTYDSIVYDTLLEESGSRDGYEKYYGYITVYSSVGMVISSLLGGVASSIFSLSTAYFLSVPGGIIAIICLLYLREPRLHKASTDIHIARHTKDTLKIVFQKGTFAILLITIVLISLVLEFMLAVDQLWPLALALPVVLYGPLNALLLFAYGLSAPLAAWVAKSRRLLIASSVLLIVFTAMLTVSNMPIITIAQFGLTAVASALVTLLTGRLHDNLPSHLRSGGASSVSTLRTLTFIPLVFIFGWITKEYSVFTAAYLIIPLAIMGAAGLVKLLGYKRTVL